MPQDATYREQVNAAVRRSFGDDVHAAPWCLRMVSIIRCAAAVMLGFAKNEEAMTAKFSDDHKIETYKSMISISIEGFKLLVLLNGGAAAGIIASYKAVQDAVEHGSLKLSIFLFVAGIISAGCVPICSYLTQYILFNEAMEREKKGAHLKPALFAMALNVVSVACFAAGTLVAVFNLK
ncbi:hypothetical protein [Paraburkholderia sediminicola]|uniref:hypothetical protein n=1 Tax=Paraburkholderia sediminicola TaxID=458836 RepID=UPI0038B8DC98